MHKSVGNVSVSTLRIELLLVRIPSSLRIEIICVFLATHGIYIIRLHEELMVQFGSASSVR